MGRLRKAGLAAAVGAALLLPAARAGAAGTDTSTVTVVHGIPGEDLGLDPALPVDVLVNGSLCALTGLEFGDISPRLDLPAGTYDLEVKVSDGACGGATAVGADDVDVHGGINASVVAHLDAAGEPTLSVFVNDLSPAALYQARVAVHHTAAAPAVDVDLVFVYDGRSDPPSSSWTARSTVTRVSGTPGSAPTRPPSLRRAVSRSSPPR
jgi:hypothetical protein